ncbi:unnamed protein product [Strongylus vulgaris]|uniref:Uncharacterized protein n=1 Tax=Strongylus vulgaris TaxID=40348 RepID=A0A3P7L4H1_STRVU|nr:unnamed protein product [Strongylus vulgaris]
MAAVADMHIDLLVCRLIAVGCSEEPADGNAIPTMEHLDPLTLQSTITTKKHETPVLTGTIEASPSLAASTVTEACE